MTYIIPSQNDNAPLGRSAFESTVFAGQAAANAAAGVVAGVASPTINAAAQLGILGAVNPSIRITELGDPYSGHTPETDAAFFAIYGLPAPPAAVMTHCMVRDEVEYRSIPTSALDPKSLAITLRYQVATYNPKKGDPYPVHKQFAPKGVLLKDGKGQRVAKNVEAVPRSVSDYETTEDYQKAHALVMDGLRNNKDLEHQKMDDVVTQTVRTPEVDAYLKSAAYTSGKKELSGSLNKVYVGDHVPKVLELRFVLHDTLVDEGKSLKLVRSRFELLSLMHSQFCANPRGNTRYESEKTLRSVAAEINASNVRGRLVELRSKGIDPYGVSVWLTTSFEHREVPENDVIALRVTLREFEALYSAPSSASASPNDASAGPVAVAPSKPVRPSYNGVG